MPKVEYPAYFEGGLVGMRATEKIEHREAFLSVPYKMLMTVDAARNHPVLGGIINYNPHIFSPEEKGDWEQLTLTLYLLHEYNLGEDSFWKPYIDLMPDVKFFCHWTEKEILETQDMHIATYAREYREEIEADWLDMKTCMRKYPDIFKSSTIDEKLFYKFYAQVCTRCFGWGLPSTTMIPMADNCNH